MCALQEGSHHALLLLLLNQEPSAEALDGWRGVQEGEGEVWEQKEEGGGGLLVPKKEWNCLYLQFDYNTSMQSVAFICHLNTLANIVEGNISLMCACRECVCQMTVTGYFLVIFRLHLIKNPQL